MKKLARTSALLVDPAMGAYGSGTLIRFFDSTDTLGQYGVVLMAAHARPAQTRVSLAYSTCSSSSSVSAS